MTLKLCRECKKRVSDEAQACPHCGAPSPTAYPERRISGPLPVVLTVAASLALLALCARAGDDGQSTVPDSEEATWDGPPVVDVAAIAGRSPDEIAAVFGPPDSVTTEKVNLSGPAYPLHYYGDGAFEVFFVEGRGEWITVWGRGALPYSIRALPAMGLESRSPTWDGGRNGMRWENIPSLLELSLFPAEGDTATAGTAWYAVIDVEHPL